MEFSLAEMMMIAFVALLLYGGRLPKVAMAVGRALGEFKRGLRETSDMVRFEVQEAERATARTTPRAPEPPAERYGAEEPAAEDLAQEDISIPESVPDAPEEEASAESPSEGDADPKS